MKNADVVIVGAGVAGLIAAIELEKAGFSPLIVEAGDVPGGRLKTDLIDGFLLDHGFQVLLTAYPEARHYLDYDALGLRNFEPGAVVLAGKETYRLSDPMRHPEKILPMLFSGIGKLSDKIKMASLVNSLKSRKPGELFQEHENVSTLEYLRDKGFSDKIIEQFFRPFFSGIFLEPDLSTSAKMFEFVFKMFSEGHAALPSEGIQGIPKQLISRLQRTEILYNSPVEKITSGAVNVPSGEIKAEDILIATAPHNLLPGLSEQKQKYHSVLNLYFESGEPFIQDGRIGLVAGKKGLINNFCYPSVVQPGYAPEGKHLLSVSIVNVPDESMDEILKQTLREWQSLTGRDPDLLRFIRAYPVKNALPVMDHSTYSMQWTATKVQDHIFLAGDYLLYGSLNAAMTSGRTAAQGIISSRH